MLYATNGHLMELVDIKKVNINFQERMITIPKGKPKKSRLCYLHESVRNI